MSEEGGRGGWELTKENIQPLSSGRRMAFLDESLSVRNTGPGGGFESQQEYEAHHLDEIKKMVTTAEGKQGEDPLQAWIDVVKYFEQHFPNMGPTVQKQFVEVLKKAAEAFYLDKKYANDKRYVEILIKSVSIIPAPPLLQVRYLSTLLEQKLGELVSDMYIKLAELYKKVDNTKKASEILNIGLKKGAEPQGLLREMLTHVEVSWAEGFARKLQEGRSGASQRNEGERNFASVVPTGERGEPVSIREHLPPAAAMSFKKPAPIDRGRRHAQLFNEEEGTSSARSQSYRISQHLSSSENINPVRMPDLTEDSDSENRQEPSRWNTGDTHLDNPVIPAPSEKIRLYVESESPPSSTTCSTSAPKRPNPVGKRVLKELSVAGEEESAPPIAPPSTITTAHDREERVTTSTLTKDGGAQAPPVKQDVPITKPRKNFIQLDENYMESGGYRELPADRMVDYKALKEDEWWERREKRLRAKLSDKKISELEKLVQELKIGNEKYVQIVKTLEDKLNLADNKLKSMDAKIRSLERLEAENENLTRQLTELSTKTNVLESRLHRDKVSYENQLQEVHETYEQKLQNCIAECDLLRRENEKLISEIQCQRQQMITNESSEYEGIVIEKNSAALDRRPLVVDIDVRSRNSGNNSTTSSDQGASEITRFNGGDMSCSVAANSFMPNEYDMSIVGTGENINANNNENVPGRRALVDRPLENDMMNDTPATAPPMDFEIPPPIPSFGIFGNIKKPARFNLYESMSQDASVRKTSKAGSFSSIKREPRSISGPQPAQENAIPPPSLSPPFQPDAARTEPEPRTQDLPASGGSEFLRPTLSTYSRPTFPSNESAPSTSGIGGMSGSSDVSQRLAMLSKRPLNDYPAEEEEEDLIVRRHQQTGVDLNVSNLTTALMLGPKPLINSTPERERTLRNLRGIAPSEIRSLHAPSEMEETGAQDFQAGISSRVGVSRYNSVLYDPPLNLSTIQETSRENRSRSRSTTGSSSGATMSSTRFGVTGATSTTTTPHFNNITRSASIPRSANSAYQQQSNNGYYSDTNAK